jgi:hypothetical protein
LLHAGFGLGLLFNPEDEGDMFLQKGRQLPKYKALYSRRKNSSFSRDFAKLSFAPILWFPARYISITFAFKSNVCFFLGLIAKYRRKFVTTNN